MKILLTGDVMTGRGIDQVMAHPGEPRLYETWARSAVDYVELAEAKNGPIPRAVEPSYIWGEALEILDGAAVDARIVNLETAVTDTGEPWPDKGIHYRMHPGNVEAIRAAKIDCCVLANNHVLDWSYPGLTQTLSTLHDAGLKIAGAGTDRDSATRPAVIETTSGHRVVVVALGSPTSGIPPAWSAGVDRPGVALTESLSSSDIDALSGSVGAVARDGDIVVVSIHWGPNWGYDVPRSHARFARRLIDQAGVHIVHGHSSHHPLGIEVYRGHLILYGCGDLINDYEGIQGHEEYHPDLGALYLVTVDPLTGELARLDLIPMRQRRFRLERAPADEIRWLADTLTRGDVSMGADIEFDDGRSLVVRSGSPRPG